MSYKVFLGLSFTLLMAAAQAESYDFTTADGAERTCKRVLVQSSAATATATAQQALVICRDIDLVRQVATFVRKIFDRDDSSHQPKNDHELSAVVRDGLIHVRTELRSTRAILEKISLHEKGEGLLLSPTKWKFDLDGDGTIKPWERFFFAIPKKDEKPTRIPFYATDADYAYIHDYQLNAQFRVDQSDIQWALGYHYFAEALIEMVLSYTLEKSSPYYANHSIVLADPAGMRRAHTLLVSGFKSTAKLRRMLQAETDDEQEWISNPKQHNSVFPVSLDEGDFIAWEMVSKHIIPLFEGKTLLASTAPGAGVLGKMSKMCPKGSGLNLPALFQRPPRRIFEVLNEPVQRGVCQPFSAKKPRSQLIELLGEYADTVEGGNEAGAKMMWRLFWVN